MQGLFNLFVVFLAAEKTESRFSTNSAVICNLFQALLAHTVKRMPSLPTDLWCKIHYFEKGHVTARFYISEWNFVVNGSPTRYDGNM